MSIAIQWVSQIMSIGLEMAIPVGVGYWLDERWGTQPWLMICGAVLGSAVSFSHIFQLAARAKKSADQTRRRRS